MDDEIFAPFVSVTPVSDLEEAIQRCNETDFGLSAAIFTRDLGAAFQFVEGVTAGVVNVNQPTTGIESQAPFGGLGRSGGGSKELGPGGVEFYIQRKTAVMRQL